MSLEGRAATSARTKPKTPGTVGGSNPAAGLIA